jgi:hypothetical protein
MARTIREGRLVEKQQGRRRYDAMTPRRLGRGRFSKAG